MAPGQKYLQICGQRGCRRCTQQPFGRILYRPSHWPLKNGFLLQNIRFVSGKYAAEVDVDVATLWAFGRILYRPVDWTSKTCFLV